jgi:hypothetical protein
MVVAASVLLPAAFAAVTVIFTLLLERSSPERSVRFVRAQRELIEAFTQALDRSRLNPKRNPADPKGVQTS